MTDRISHVKPKDAPMVDVRVMQELELGGGPKQSVTPAQSKAIEAAYGDCVLLKSSEEEIRSLKRSFAERFGISIGQVNSVVAWVLIRANHALEHEGLSKEYSEDLIALGRRVELAPSDAERLTMIQIESDRLGIDSQPLQRAVNDYLSRNHIGTVRRRRRGAEERGLHAASAAGADYDTWIKQAWRETWFKYLEAHIPRQERKNKVVLCLPSGQPEREISGYLKLGFRRANIIAVEGDRRNGPEFARRCRELGVSFFNAKLEEVIPDLKRPVDVLSLDFAGCFCSAYEAILHAVPLRAGAVVMINCQEGRERMPVQQSLKQYPHFLRAMLQDEERMIDLPPLRVLTAASPAIEIDGQEMVSDIDREIGFSSMLIDLFGQKELQTDDAFEAPYGRRRLPVRAGQQIEPYQLTSALSRAILGFSGFDQRNCPDALVELVRSFRSVCEKRNGHRVAVCAPEQIRYRSHATSAHRPFSTFIATLHTSDTGLADLKGLTEFLDTIQEAASRTPKTSREMRLTLVASADQETRLARWRKLTPMSKYWGALVTAEVQGIVNGRLVATIPMADLVRDLRMWAQTFRSEVSALEASRVRVRILGDPTPYLSSHQ